MLKTSGREKRDMKKDIKIKVLINIIEQLIMVENLLHVSDEITIDMWYDFWEQDEKDIWNRINDFIADADDIQEYDY